MEKPEITFRGSVFASVRSIACLATLSWLVAAGQGAGTPMHKVQLTQKGYIQVRIAWKKAEKVGCFVKHGMAEPRTRYQRDAPDPVYCSCREFQPRNSPARSEASKRTELAAIGCPLSGDPT